MFKKLALAVGWITTFLFGSGFVWQYRQAEAARQQLAITQAQWSVAQDDRRLKLRDQTTEHLTQVATMVAAGKACDQYGPERVTLPALIQDLDAYEAELAKLENRSPRIDLYKGIVRPCPPSGFTVH